MESSIARWIHRLDGWSPSRRSSRKRSLQWDTNRGERFRREARSAGVLSHPNIVTIHDFSDTGDPMFIAMEFVEGRTLAEAMSSGALPLEMTLGVLRSASDALDYAHAQHIVHRDIKPANFLINKNGRLKITDFGIAKFPIATRVLPARGCWWEPRSICRRSRFQKGTSPAGRISSRWR